MLSNVDIDLEISKQEIPTSAQGTYRKALSGNRPAAVKAMCLACQGWEDGARQAIRDCPSVGCPLHAVRPFQKKAGAGAEMDNEIDSDESSEESGNALAGQIKEMVLASLAEAKQRIIDHLHRHGASQRGYILFSTGIPESLWNDAIRSLLADNSIEREGEKRNTRYRLKGA